MPLTEREAILIGFKAVKAKTKEYELGENFSEKENELFCLQQQNSVSEVLAESEYH